jgi:FtsP/CotA-like multicopper oxidase with cupredoxin domain
MTPTSSLAPRLARKEFLAGAGALLAATSLAPRRAQAATPTIIRAETRVIEVDGRSARVFGLRQPNGTHGLVTDVGTPFRVRLENASGQATLVHWHGLTPPYRQDGVPYVSVPPIADGGFADYDFPLTFGGTYWMHSHQNFQEQKLMVAPLIIRDPADRGADEQDVVLLLHDFTFRQPEEIFASVRHAAMPMSMPGMAMPGMAMPGMAMPGMAMHRDGPDLNDVRYDAFLANERTLRDPEVVRVEPRGRVRLRIINGASSSNFVVDLGALSGELIAVDGHPMTPVRGSRFPLAMAQRADVRVQLPPGRGAFPVLATLEGSRARAGIILASAGAHVAKVAPMAARPTPPLGLDLERTLRGTKPLAPKAADRVYHIELTGTMQGYRWGLNGQEYPHAAPFRVATGERVEFVLRNTTGMSHPMHLHGHVFQVVAIDGRRFSGARRDTVLVPPKTSVTIAFDADNPGRWLFHCHNLYHMMAGMTGTVLYDRIS